MTDRNVLVEVRSSLLRGCDSLAVILTLAAMFGIVLMGDAAHNFLDAGGLVGAMFVGTYLLIRKLLLRRDYIIITDTKRDFVFLATSDCNFFCQRKDLEQWYPVQGGLLVRTLAKQEFFVRQEEPARKLRRILD